MADWQPMPVARGRPTRTSFIVGEWRAKSSRECHTHVVVTISDGVVRDQVFRIADLALVKPMITRLRFENCVILGPAIVAPLGSGVFDSCLFNGPPEAILWDFPADVTRIGVIGLDACEFYGCSFQGIGFAGTEEFRQYFRDQVVAEGGAE